MPKTGKKGAIMIDDLLEYNNAFVSQKGYEKYITNKYPDKKIAIVTCMDTRLTELLPASLGIKNGDVKMIKNAGGTITHPFGSAMRSLLVAIYELGVKEVMIIGHSDCGAQHMDSETMLNHMRERGVSQDHIDMMEYCGVDLRAWLSGLTMAARLFAAVCTLLNIIRLSRMILWCVVLLLILPPEN